MPKQLNVNLGFTADTSQAKKSLQELQKSLQDIAKLPGKSSSLFDDTDLKNASKAAMELQQHLSAAVNTKTGNLDLSRFSTSLKAANKDLNSYYNKLAKIGPEGQEAFLKLARSISTAEAPVTKINAKLAEMGTSLKNTARWQLSSSIIHGFMGTIQGAYGYAQDLNESLNNIRIVTGQSVDEMAKFAEKANESAKALSTTTTAYTDAALIFYQQGLSGKEVTDRTNTVIKMANVERQSAEEVSSSMTAIWNNFADGSHELEYYADVITALGASTASSSKEIAEGLEKFASIGETVGLSYEYATSALAAVVSNTRQSADVVGTAFKTLFARLQGLKLGETLEDGVDLNKYSQALETVGVKVLDVNGELRDANDILKDTAGRWDTLTKAQQTALAQTVAGTRQYSQFIALMESWDDVEENLQTAQNSEGTLQSQADIYAESWEAAQKRVKAAAQGIYQDLLDDKFFIGLTNGLEKVLEAIHEVINGFGGMKGVLTALGSIFLTTYAQKMPEALNNLKQNFMVMTGQATKEMITMQTKMQSILTDIKNSNNTNYSSGFKLEAEGIATVIDMQKKYIVAKRSMTEAQQQEYEARIANVQAMYDELKALDAEIEKIEKESTLKQESLSKNNLRQELTNNRNQQDMVRYAAEDPNNSPNVVTALQNQLAKLSSEETELLAKIQILKQEFKSVGLDPTLLDNSDRLRNAINSTTEQLKEQMISWREISETGDELPQIAARWKLNATQIKSGSNEMKTFKKNVDLYVSSLKNVVKNNSKAFSKVPGIQDTMSKLDELKQKFDNGTIGAEEFANKFDKLSNKMKTQMNSAAAEVNNDLDEIRNKLAVMFKDNPDGLKELENMFDKLGIKIKQLNDSKINTQGMIDDPNDIFQASTAWTQFASSAMATYTALNNLKNAFTTIGEAVKGNASGMEVFGAAVSTLMGIMMAYTSVQALATTLIKKDSIAKQMDVIATVVKTGATYAETAAEAGLTTATWAQVVANIALQTSMPPLLIITLALVAAMAALALAIVAVVAIFKAVQAATPEGKLKALKEEATECSKALDEAKTAAEELKSAFDNYDSLVERLNECTQGTQEWKDALIDVNNAVLDLMANYPDLAQYVTRVEKTGQLKISQAGMNSMRDNADAAVINAQAATLQANANVKNQEIDMQAESIAKDNYYLPRWLEDKLYNDPQSLSSYDDIRQMIADNYDPTYEENPLDKNSAEFQQWLDEQMIELKNIDGMDELIAAIQANTLAQETGNQAIADNILANDKNVQGSKYAEEVTSASGDVYGQLYENALTKLEDDGWGTDGISKATKVNDEAKRVFSEYAKAAGITGVTLTDTTGADGNRKFVYEDAEGNEITVSIDAMRKIKAAADAQEQLGEAAQNLIQTFTQLDQSGQSYDKAIMEMLSNKNFENSTQSEVEALKDLAETDEDGMAGVLGDKFGGEDGVLDNIDAQALGYESAEEMITAFEQGIEDYETAVENIGQNWLQAVQSAFENIDTSELTLKQQKTIGNAMNQAFAIDGEEGLKTFTDVIENIPTDNLDEFANTIGQIDWQETSVEDLRKQLQLAEIDTSKLSDEALKALIDSMDGTFTSAEKLAGKFSELHSIIDGLSDGDSINSEDYDKLGSEYQKYFRLQLDGTYKLIGAAKDLQNALKENQIEEFKSEIENRDSEIQRLEGIQNKNYNFDNLSQTDFIKNEEGAEYAYSYNGQHTQEQLEFLQEFSQGNAELQQKIETWQTDLADGSVDNIQVLKDIAAEVQNCGAEFENLDATIQEHLYQQYEMQLAIAGSAEDMNELKNFLDDGTISAEVFTAAALEMDRSLDLQNLDSDELEDYADYLQEAAINMEGFNNEMSDTEAEIVAKGIMKMNRAIDTLADNFSKAGKNGDSWRDILEQSTETSEEYAEAMVGTKKAVGELLDISSDFVSNDFVKEHLEDIEKAATGDADAIDNLKAALADDIIAKIILDNADFITDTDAVMNAYNELKANIPDIDVGVTLDGEDDFITSLQNLIDSTGMTVDQVNALCDALGFEAQYESDTQPVEYKVPLTSTQHTRTVNAYDEHGNPTDWVEKEQIVDSELVPFEGAYTAFAISTNGESPKISRLTKKATGSSNNYSSQNKGGKSTPGKSKSGGGGGKTPEHKHKEKVDKFEADPFHKVNQELEDVEHNLKMIDKQQSHVFGKELINNLKKQNAQLKKQNKLHKEKLGIAKKEAKILRNKLKAEGVKFDGDNIANYNAKLQAAENKINALIKKYNSLSAAEQEAYDKAYKEKKSPIEKAEEYYEKLKKQMDKYTDYMSTVYSEEEAMQDALFQQIENNLKAYEVEIELKLDMSEARRAMNKFLKDMSTDIKNMYKTSAEWATTFETSEKDAGTYKDDIDTKLKQLEDYKKASVGGEKDMFATESEKYKAITDLEKEILEDSENLLNEYQAAYDNLRDAFGEVADQFNEILDQFDSINDTLDHYAKVIELLYGGETDNGRKQLAEVYSLQKENSLESQDAMRKWGDELLKRRAEAIANGYDKDDSYIKDIDAQIEENNKNLESEIENYIDTIQRELENSIKMAQSQMDKSIWGASMADVRQEWDDKKAMADGYYDSVEKIYQLESLESKWKAAITKTSSLKAQQQLAAIMDKQVASLESKNALSEKDIELAEKELAVYQAQIALEEAQNNKNSMKLTRDETGNWSYQYVADEGDVADKQQSYLDKMNEWRTASINAAEEIAERTMDAYEAFSERMTEIMNDVTLSEEERDAKIAELNATYWGEDGIITKLVEDSNYIQSTANQATYVELAGLYEADKANFERMTEDEKTIIENMNAAGKLSYKDLRDYVIGDDGESGIYGEIYDLCKRTNEASSGAWKSMAADAINRMYKDHDSVSNTVKQAYADMKGALKIYDKAIEDSEKASGVEWSKVSLQLDGVQKKIKKTAKRVDDFTSKLKALSAFEKAVLKIKETWDKTSGSIKKATSDLEKYYKLLAKGKNKSTGGKSNSTGSGGNGNTGGGGAGSGSGGNGKLTVGETVTYTGGTYYYDSYGTSPAGRRGPGKKVKITQIKEDGRPYPIHVTSKDSAYGWLTKSQLSGYDTGGYTGDWAGGDGRLALLHSKELVLNKDDTKNILDTVQILRQFTIKDLAQLVENAISNGLSSLIGKALNFDSNNYDTTQVNNNTNEEQNVTINVEAVFPHANDIDEIREAILSLPNYASQFKMRK